MNFEILKGFFYPILFIGIGLFLRVTQNERFISAKSWWKMMLILGVIGVVIQILKLL
jgi:Co/Zn/Cd efflux system component